MSKKTSCIIGVVIGVIIIFVGIFVQNPERFTLGERDVLGQLISFGGDFYTEIYAATIDAGNAVQRNYVNICNAIGWLIICLGLTDICFFAYKFSVCDKEDEEDEVVEEIKNILYKIANAKNTSNTPQAFTNEELLKVETSIPCHTNLENCNKQTTPMSATIKDGEKVCPKCGTTQRIDRRVCWSCGQQFDN